LLPLNLVRCRIQLRQFLYFDIREPENVFDSKLKHRTHQVADVVQCKRLFLLILVFKEISLWKVEIFEAGQTKAIGEIYIMPWLNAELRNSIQAPFTMSISVTWNSSTQSLRALSYNRVLASCLANPVNLKNAAQILFKP
jgi:hypothetical protein